MRNLDVACWYCGQRILGHDQVVPEDSYHMEVIERQLRRIERDARMEATPPEGWLYLGQGKVRIPESKGGVDNSPDRCGRCGHESHGDKPCLLCGENTNAAVRFPRRGRLPPHRYACAGSSGVMNDPVAGNGDPLLGMETQAPALQCDGEQGRISAECWAVLNPALWYGSAYPGPAKPSEPRG